MTKREDTKAGQRLSRRGASEGQRARQAALAPDERKAIARRAAQSRWSRSRGERPPERLVTIRSLGLDWLIVHDLILDALARNVGRGFHNGDQGHPVYGLGANGIAPRPEDPDGPDRNGLYLILLQTSKRLDSLAKTRVENWQQFCELAVAGFRRNLGERSALREAIDG